MSVKSAALALIEYDSVLSEQIAAGDSLDEIIPSVRGSWTLSLAASAAGVSEEQVILAVSRQIICMRRGH